MQISSSISREFKGNRYSHKKLEERELFIAHQLAKHAGSSPARAMERDAAIRSLERFMKNPKTKSEKILETHKRMTLKRASRHKEVLLIQDTSSLNFHGHQKTTGLGSISKAGNCEVQGLFVHTGLVTDSKGIPLGIATQLAWARVSEIQEVGSPARTKKKPAPEIEGRESIRWLMVLRDAHEMNKECPQTKITVLADRESDFYEYFLEAKRLGQSIISRAYKNREIDDDGNELLDYKRLKIQDIQSIEIPSSGDRKGRQTELEIRITPISIAPPENSHHTDVLEGFTAVYITERGAPEGEEPLNWVLITNRRVRNVKDALKIRNAYMKRWEIESFHKILKSGYHIEKCKFNDGEKLKKMLAFFSVLGWKTLQTTHLCEKKPNASARLLYTDLELKVLVDDVESRGQKVPQGKLSLADAVGMVAA